MHHIRRSQLTHMSVSNPSVWEVLPLFIGNLYSDNKRGIWTATMVFVVFPIFSFLAAPYVSESPQEKCTVSFLISCDGEVSKIPLRNGCWMWNVLDLEVAILVILCRMVCVLIIPMLVIIGLEGYWIRAKVQIMSDSKSPRG